MITCLDCDKEAKWHVWYSGFSSPIVPPFAPFNLAYNSLCDEHAYQDMVEGRNGYSVACIKPIRAHSEGQEPSHDGGAAYRGRKE